MSILNNIYPPTIPTYIKPFIITPRSQGQSKNISEPCIIPFTISKYNAKSEIANYVQITVYKQITNACALDLEYYPCGIMLAPIFTDNTLGNYIKIRSIDIENEGFEINNYYRVQIRLIDVKAGACPVPLDIDNWDSSDSIPQQQSISSWLRDNEQYFSEWSTVCLVRGILQPVLILRNLNESGESEDNFTYWRSGNVHITGKLYFPAYPRVLPAEEVPIGEQSSVNDYIVETDYLKEYSIKLYDESDNLFFDSGTIYGNNYSGINEINYVIKRIFREGEKYKMQIDYSTKTGYSDTAIYYLMMINEELERLNVSLSAIEDFEKGRISLRIQNVVTDVFSGNIIIRRTCGDTNFTVWEDVAKISVENQVLDITWHDYTVQSGKWYEYGVQSEIVDEDGDINRGILSIYEEKLMIEFDDIFLNADNSQICIRYNPQISSFQHSVLESKVDTIGSKYPFVKRNGNAEYKQFPISGTITYYMDNYDNLETYSNSLKETINILKSEERHLEEENSLFTSRINMYGQDLLTLYENRMNATNSDTFNTVIYEKDFRDKVKEFLYKNNVKLFRSATEGNILIKLMNISFTPNQSLGRTIWNFNATAYEIDDYSVENCDYYNIQTIGISTPNVEYIDNYIGQLNGTFKAGTSIISAIEEKYQKYCKKNYKAIIDKIVYLRIQFNEKPYLINMGSSVNENPVVATDTSSAKETTVGYLVTLKKASSNERKTIIVNPSGIYELKGQDVDIIDIYFPADSNVTVDYEIALFEKPDISKTIRSIIYKKSIGQIRGIFDQTQELISELQRKYSGTYSTWYQELIAVNGMRIEADEGTVAYIREEDEEDYQRHVIGPTESLDFYDPESVISGMYFYGRHFVEASESELARNSLPVNKFKDSDIHETSTAAITNPENNTIYWIGPTQASEVRKLYYRNKWYDLNDNNDIEMPVAAMVDYYCEYLKGNYATT